ncbi:MAG: chromosome partitioning protein ParB [Marmoricola sp.]|nr:chromosome partitioning protein ParB [Marmoricola sp.]MCW2826994.1 chromosome partitioning protein ParB [Marmoricola sp.]
MATPRVDAETDFQRARRHQVLSRLAGFLRHDAGEANETLSFDEVVTALGRRGERSLGVQKVPLDQIVGSVDKVRDFDRRFRPTSDRSRQRWQRLAEKSRLGEYLPPIDVYKLGNLYFVRDGHHRVSVARMHGADSLDANVTEIDTVMSTDGLGGRRDLDGRNWGLRFLKRVPLTGACRAAINCTDPADYQRLAEMVEAWACRLMHEEGSYFDKPTMAVRWFDEEYTPVLKMIDEAGVRGPDETGADAYLRVAGERYRLIREHDWNEDVMRMVLEESRPRRRSGQS